MICNEGVEGLARCIGSASAALNGSTLLIYHTSRVSSLTRHIADRIGVTGGAEYHL